VHSFLLTGQQQTLYRDGSIVLPNTGRINGYIWMPSNFDDTTNFIFFRYDFATAPIRFNSTELISCEFDGRRLVSLMVPFKGGNYQRIIESQFDGDKYKLYSTEDGRDKIFYLTSSSGTITKLINTYSLPSAENKFSVTYNNEYKAELAIVFQDYPDIIEEIPNLKFQTGELVKLMIRYHQEQELPFVSYTTPKGTIGSVGISGGYSNIQVTNLIATPNTVGSPFFNFRLFGELVSEFKPVFMNAGISYFRGQSWHDFNEEYLSKDIFYDITTNTSLLNFDIRMGMKLFKAGNFSPYIAVGGEYNLYLDYSSTGIREEVYNDDIMVVYTSIIEDENSPAGFPGIILEVGTGYKYNKNSDFRFGASYRHFFDGEEMMKNGIGFSLTYSRVIF